MTLWFVGWCQKSRALWIFCLQLRSSRAFGRLPARIVCGFAGGEDDKTQSWTNEQTDAHAWAEVFDGNQWLRVDPTSRRRTGEGEDPQQNQNNGQGQNPDQQDGEDNPENPQTQQGENPNGQEPDEDRDERELPEELLETLRQAKQLLDALKTDEKPLGSLEAKEGRLGQRIQRNKKDWWWSYPCYSFFCSS